MVIYDPKGAASGCIIALATYVLAMGALVGFWWLAFNFMAWIF